MASTAERIVGRDQELARIVRALDGLAEAGPRLIEISGEPGIGKTRLVQELCQEAESRGYLVLRGNAAEFERGVPFAPVVDAMDPYLATVEPELLGEDAELRRELGAIFPSLRDPDGEEAVAGVGDERHRAWRAVRDLLARLAAERPLVIALDDLQWADDATVEVIASLLAKPPETRVLLALAQRAGRAHPKLEGALGSVERRRGAYRFRLGPLDAAEANELLEGRVDEPLRHSLFEAGGGNPFFMQQLARVTAESGPDSLTAGALDELDLPPAVAAALAEEIASLPEGTRRLVEAASVAGERFEPDLMADIAQATEDEALAAVDELLERDIVKPTDVPRRFAFRHPLVWRAVYEGAPGGWRLAAHRRAADALRGRRAPAAERAHHVEHAARRGDEDAVQVLAEAGRATAAQTPATAARWLRAALRLLPDGPGHAEHRAALLVELAATLRGAGELESCRGALMEALAHLPAGAVAERVRIEADCASVEGWLGRPADAHRRLTRAREDLDAEGTPEAVLLDTRLSLDALYALDFDCHESCGMRALEAARALGDPALISEAAAAQSVGEAVGARVAAAREHREESVAALERLGDEELAGRLEIFYYLAWAENYIQEPELALATAERGLAASRAAGQGHLLVPLQLARVFPLQMLGRLAEAIEQGRGGPRGRPDLSQSAVSVLGAVGVRLCALPRRRSRACPGPLRRMHPGVRGAGAQLPLLAAAGRHVRWCADRVRGARARARDGPRGHRRTGRPDAGGLRKADHLARARRAFSSSRASSRRPSATSSAARRWRPS